MCPFSHLGSLLVFLIHFYKLTGHRFNNNLHLYSFFISEDLGLLCRLNGITYKLDAGGSICSLLKQGSGLDCSAVLVDAKDSEGRSSKPILVAERELGGEGCSSPQWCPEHRPLKKRSQAHLKNLNHEQSRMATEPGGQCAEKWRRKCSFTHFF